MIIGTRVAYAQSQVLLVFDLHNRADNATYRWSDELQQFSIGFVYLGSLKPSALSI